jgi:hypothetical protein
MAEYIRKTYKIEAVKFTRNNIEEIKEFTNNKASNFILNNNYMICDLESKGKTIKVLENKYIVKHKDGHFYICDKDDFESIYELI